MNTHSLESLDEKVVIISPLINLYLKIDHDNNIRGSSIQEEWRLFYIPDSNPWKYWIFKEEEGKAWQTEGDVIKIQNRDGEEKENPKTWEELKLVGVGCSRYKIQTFDNRQVQYDINKSALMVVSDENEVTSFYIYRY